MSPEMSRACATVKQILNLEEDGPQMAELLDAARKADSVNDLPNWARAVLNLANSKEES
jgi:hypothetical protein